MNKVLSMQEFFRKYCMHPQQVDLDHHTQIFMKHLEAGLTDSPLSLAMLPTYISPAQSVPHLEDAIVIDAGGTNFRAALVHFDKEGMPHIKDFRKTQMPGTQGEITQEEFFDACVDIIKDLCNKSKKIGFCFSYPTQALANHDGKLLFFTKGIQVQDSAGMTIGDGLKKALKRAGYGEDFDIVIVNDTVTTLLAGLIGTTGQQYDGCIGAILGTGTNIAYPEIARHITKIDIHKPHERQIINLESGNFDGHIRGSIDEEFVNETLPYHQQAFEKAISGAYLGPLIHKTIIVATHEGLFSKALITHLQARNAVLSTAEIAQFLEYPSKGLLGYQMSEQERNDLYTLCSLIVERAAKLFAVSLAAVIMKSGYGKSPQKPTRIIVEGTTFYQTPGLKDHVLHYLSEILAKESLHYYELVGTENSSLLGAAIAALTT